jgi:hypothetical protein
MSIGDMIDEPGGSVIHGCMITGLRIICLR